MQLPTIRKALQSIRDTTNSIDERDACNELLDLLATIERSIPPGCATEGCIRDMFRDELED